MAKIGPKIRVGIRAGKIAHGPAFDPEHHPFADQRFGSLCGVCAKGPQGHLDWAEPQTDEDRLREALEDVVLQFAYYSNGHVHTGGLSALEDAFAVLGWDDPHRMDEMACDEGDCLDLATCGWNEKTTGTRRRTCGRHMREGDYR